MISYCLYYPFYIILKVLLRPFSQKIFARHSFYFKKIKFGTSDIDLTLYSKESSHVKNVSLVKYLPVIKFFVPILGEINYVDQTGLDKLKKIINPLELARDPELSRLVGPLPKPSLAQKEVFLLRVFSSDVKNMKKDLKGRIKKISYCMSLMNPKEEMNPSHLESFESFINYLRLNILECENSVVYDYLQYLMDESIATKNSNRFVFLEDCLSQKWEKLQNSEGVEEGQEELIIEFLKWELWGLYTQLPTFKDHKSLLAHILIMSNLLSNLSKDYEDCSEFLINQVSDLA